MSAPRPLLLLALALALAAAAPGCDSDEPQPSQPLPTFIPDPELVREAQVEARAAALQAENRERGWQCGYREAWNQVLFDARDKAPLRWRGDTMGAVFVIGLVLFAVGVGGTFLLAFFLPRLRRRRKQRRKAGAAADDAPPNPWLAFLRDLSRRWLKRLGRLLQVDHFDRAAAETRVATLHDGRDAERLIHLARESAAALAGDEPPPRAAALLDALGEREADLVALRALLDVAGGEAGGANLERAHDVAEKVRRAARQLRLDLLRAELAAPLSEEDWEGWTSRVEGWPELPVERRSEEPPELASWVRPVGWAGVAGFALALPMTAAWTAAGAFPLFFALLFSVAAIGATLTARVYLFQSGRKPLLPGLADKLAGWLAVLTVITTTVMAISAMATEESGLDLGDPPPIEAPGELEAQAPPPPPVVPAKAPE